MEALQFENSQLRAELRAQQAVQKKLKNEKRKPMQLLKRLLMRLRESGADCFSYAYMDIPFTNS